MGGVPGERSPDSDPVTHPATGSYHSRERIGKSGD
jgi:hypothetical protein